MKVEIVKSADDSSAITFLFCQLIYANHKSTHDRIKRITLNFNILSYFFNGFVQGLAIVFCWLFHLKHEKLFSESCSQTPELP